VPTSYLAGPILLSSTHAKCAHPLPRTERRTVLSISTAARSLRITSCFASRRWGYYRTIVISLDPSIACPSEVDRICRRSGDTAATSPEIDACATPEMRYCISFDLIETHSGVVALPPLEKRPESAFRLRPGCGWQTRDRETLPSRTTKMKTGVRHPAYSVNKLAN